MPQGFESQDPIVQAGVRARMAPLRSLRRRYYTLHLPSQDPVVLEVDTHSNEVVAGPPGYLGANMAHVSARHSGRMGARIEEHPPGEMPTAAPPRNVGYRDPTPEPARPPEVRVDPAPASVPAPAPSGTAPGPLGRMPRMPRMPRKEEPGGSGL